MPTPALRQTLEYIKTHPERHNQGIWFRPYMSQGRPTVNHCGSAGCLAGWGVALAAENLILDHYREHGPLSYFSEAAEIFGIDDGQAEVLFWSHWQMDNLQRGVDALEADPQIGPDALATAMGNNLRQMAATHEARFANDPIEDFGLVTEI